MSVGNLERAAKLFWGVQKSLNGRASKKSFHTAIHELQAAEVLCYNCKSQPHRLIHKLKHLQDYIVVGTRRRKQRD